MRLVSMVSALFCAFCLAPASAAAIIGGDTRVQVTAPLADLGLTPSLIDDSTAVSADTFNFPITGGNLVGLAGEIEHETSGVLLTDSSGNTVSLEDFVIDTVQQLIFADVTINGMMTVDGADVFSFDLSTVSAPELVDLTNPSLALLFTATAASVLGQTFSLSIDLTDVQFGLAATAPEVVPVPAAFGMFAFGAFALNWLRRRRKTATA